MKWWRVGKEPAGITSNGISLGTVPVISPHGHPTARRLAGVMLAEQNGWEKQGMGTDGFILLQDIGLRGRGRATGGRNPKTIYKQSQIMG